MKTTNKKGFTLVELSIVLVIIGLLIGGILVGQSLIESAKMQSFIRQIGQYDAAVGIFEDKFGNLPGDNILFETAGRAVDGNIEDDDGNLVFFSGEIGGFWADLSASGLKNEDGSAFTSSADAAHTQPLAGTHIPQAKVGTNAGIFAFGVSGANYYRISTAETDGTDISNGDALKPADALAIDGKLDDGLADSGNVVARDSGTLALAATTGTDCTVAAGGPAYAVTGTTNTCQLTIRIGSSTGVLQ